MRYQDFVYTKLKTALLVYDVVKKIPRGKVGTYGRVAATVNSLSLSPRITPRMVGRALHLNPDPESVPCHRVVNSKGRVADNFAFGGWKEQKKRLEIEGVMFKNERFVNLKEHLWSGFNT
ncbi:MAG: MGMT family protein [Candidatus Blackburnbacteria bacterium]|nr:MGMT family protein [Candidatus Blackburnbacteria bacterium]